MCYAVALAAATVSYTADNTTIFPNPERGFITMLDKKISEDSPYLVKGMESTLESHKAKDQISIVLLHYYLDNFRNTATLPDKVLNINLQYNGTLPITEANEVIVNDNPLSRQAYNLSGQPVDNSYRGIVILNGKKIVR